MWDFLKKIYHQDNSARRFQLELELSEYCQGNLSIQDYYSGFLNLWAEYKELVYASVPPEGLPILQQVHEVSQRDQFLMKLRREYEPIRVNLMSRIPSPSLETCFAELFREEQRCVTQSVLENKNHQRANPMEIAYATQAKVRDMSKVQCYSCKEYGHIANYCKKNFCNYCKKSGHLIAECRRRPQNRTSQALHVSHSSSTPGFDSGSISSSGMTNITPEVVQQLIYSALSTLGISAIAGSQSWPLFQMDVKNAFLHGDLQEEVYMRLPPGVQSDSQNHVCRLRRSLYGLKQAPRAWFQKFSNFLRTLDFKQSYNDPSMFLHHSAADITILLVYVDDIIITGTDPGGIKELQASLHSSFHMKDLGILTYFLGLEVHHSDRGIFVNQHKYTHDLIALAGLENSTPVDTPLEVNVKYSQTDGDLLPDPTIYRRLVGSLIYLTITRPDISYAVNLMSQFMRQPRHLHLAAVKRIIRYLIGTPSRGIFYKAHSSLILQAYSDADWAGCPDTRRSTTGWCMYLGDALISWKCQKQRKLSKSSIESEYRAMSSACSEIVWLRRLLSELGSRYSNQGFDKDTTSVLSWQIDAS
ncbi:retrovirus-related Pol polyprotein from transposon RE1 isoform X4 [Ziziphus jujuba]|uniref:Retrovirus-related Pol polyprotein from transposon RE1 isoform X4 n=1 Tax=Ziziphus jujuba TaxID=326968 RepID=A0ABM3ZZW1_ZIZJJ|nr:retrovirus-related Pol polyprotein from transposon RE1 isoform X4 [Ziziphus jujuba]